MKYQTENDEGVEEAIKERLVFPVEYDGKIIGFNCRAISDEVKTKYYKAFKGHGLWNADTIYDGCEVILTEGIFDAITLIQLGFRAVALLGNSSLTNNDLEILKKCGQVYIFLDGDKSGEKASIEIAEKIGHKAYIVQGINLEAANIKDVNGWFVSLVNRKFKECGDKKQAYNDTLKEARKYIDDLLSNAENLVTKKYDEWLEIEDDTERIEVFENLMTIICKQYNNNEGLIDTFKKKVKEFGIQAKHFDKVKGKVIKEVANTKTKNSEDNFPSVDFNGWQVINGRLFLYNPTKEGYDEISMTAPTIEAVLSSISKNNEEVQISFTDRYNDYKQVVVRREDIVTKSGITKVLSAHGFDISERTAPLIIEYLRYLERENNANIKKKKLTDVTGYYNKDIFIGRTGEIITISGLVDKNDVDVVHKNINKDISDRQITRIDDEEWKELIRQLFPQLLKLNQRENSVGVISWFLCSMYKEPIQEKTGVKEHAPLNIVGKTGSGKTTLATFLQQMQGGTGDVLSANSKKYTIVVNMSLSNSYALLIDEYKIKDLGEFQNGIILNLVKIAYNSNYEQRGNGNNPMNNFLLLTPVCVIGENVFTGESSEAVRDRAVIFEFSRAWKDEHEDTTKKIIREINKLDLNFFNGGYAKFILNTVNDGRFDSMYERAEQRANKFADENVKITSRNITAITQLAFGIEVLKELYKIAEIECDIADEDYEAVFTHSMQHILNSEYRDSSLDIAMNYFAMIFKREFEDDEITCDFSEGLLYVQQNKFYTLLSSHAKQGKADIPNKDGLMTLIRDDLKNKDGYVRDISKLKSIKGKNKRCLVFDIDQLEKVASIDKATWINNGESEQEVFSNGTSSRVYLTEETRNMAVASTLSDRIINALKKELEGQLSEQDKKIIKSEVFGILTERLKNDKEVVQDNFVAEMIPEFLKRYKAKKKEVIETNKIIEIFKNDEVI